MIVIMSIIGVMFVPSTTLAPPASRTPMASASRRDDVALPRTSDSRREVDVQERICRRRPVSSRQGRIQTS